MKGMSTVEVGRHFHHVHSSLENMEARQAGGRAGRQLVLLGDYGTLESPQVNITLELAGIKAPLIILFSVVFL